MSIQVPGDDPPSTAAGSESANTTPLERIPDIAVTFESPDAIGSFHVDYRVNVAEVPEDKTGQLHVIVERGGE